MDKVYCKKCRWFSGYDCTCEDFLTIKYEWDSEHIVYGNPSIINRYLDCKKFKKASLLRRIWNLIPEGMM